MYMRTHVMCRCVHIYEYIYIYVHVCSFVSYVYMYMRCMSVYTVYSTVSYNIQLRLTHDTCTMDPSGWMYYTHTALGICIYFILLALIECVLNAHWHWHYSLTYWHQSQWHVTQWNSSSECEWVRVNVNIWKCENK